MQMNEQVLTALEVLRNFAENDFERHRIDVLEQDLTAPPKVEVIDDKHQTFNGVVYSKVSDGHYRRNHYIYLAVWDYYTGLEVPTGYVVHHNDWNPANNDISNLKMITKSEHSKIHGASNAATKGKKIFVCKICGEKFTSINSGNNSFCSDKCYNIYRYHIRDRVIRKCVICGTEFTADKHKNTKTCSRKCSNILAWKNTRKKEVKKIDTRDKGSVAVVDTSADNS